MEVLKDQLKKLKNYQKINQGISKLQENLFKRSMTSIH